MSTKYLRELLESVDVLNPERADERISEALQELRQVEAARAKDAELIQMLVDALRNLRDIHEFRVGREPLTGTDELAAAEAAGFKPSYP
jgi:surfactin synthase thioesterase subunit